MLALGVVILVAGTTWMIAWHQQPADGTPLSDLTRYANRATAVVMLGAMAFLISDALSFMEEMNGELNQLHSSTLTEEQIAVAVAGITLCILAFWIIYDKSRNRQPGAVGSSDTRHCLEPEPESIYRAAKWTIIYLALAFIMVLLATSPRIHTFPSYLMWCGVGLCLLGPGMVFTIIAVSMPGTNGKLTQRIIGAARPGAIVLAIALGALFFLSADETSGLVFDDIQSVLSK
ncbi:hypothetical protein A5634_03760 [Mycobacterium asiaticum]|uniref:Uncharacterized protein n=2 Tax=Mycobacterium asiaticum TaxID=1790 RepID=A0A1A3NQT3_MYCAS|nr:hypothetical protein A5634_03760 [Mycobacterium asiaticum]